MVMKHKMKLSAIFLTTVIAMGAQAQDQFCGTTYTIQRGDTLSALANQAFGSSNAFMKFYDEPANVDVLGTNPNLISIGDVITLPKCDGDEVAEVEAPEAAVDTGEKQINIVTGSGFAPFTDESLNEGGMLTQIVKDAFAASGTTNPVQIDFINDWGSHLDTLLPNGTYALEFSRFKPACDDPAKLTPNLVEECKLLWSDPITILSMGFYAPETGETMPMEFGQLKGKTICRPAGNNTTDLEENGLIDGDTITLVRPATIDECFSKLENGDVDMVSTNRFAADKAIAKRGLTDLVVPLGMVSTQTLHVVADPSNADAPVYLEMFNKGLANIKESGRFDTIKAEHLDALEAEVDALNVE